MVTVKDRDYVPGLAGVPAAESAISYIDGEAGILEYRGHRIETLAERSNFEEVAWLLLYGALPLPSELDEFRRRLSEHRALPPRVLDVLRHLPPAGHPMSALQAGLAALGMESPDVDVHDPEQRDDAIRRILAAAPLIVAAFERARRDEDQLEPDPALDTAANFLWMLHGRAPSDPETRALDAALVLHTDHTLNASTFAARVVASCEADPYTVCASAVGALKGPLHGGANERVLAQLEEIGTTANVPSWLERTLAEKGRVMGFGHRIYKTKDPRSKILQALAGELFGELGSTPIYEVALELEKRVVERLGGKGIYPNVDFYSGIVYGRLEIPTDQFTSIFALSRVAGYLAHWREQMQDNKLFRPRQIYVGVHGAEFVDLPARSRAS